MPAAQGIQIIFDENIIKVTHGAYEWSASGDTKSGTAVNWGGTYNATLKDGYVIDTCVSSRLTINNITDNTFDVVNPDITVTPTITITSKKATSQVSIDLTTLSGWGNVANGQHSIQIVAKADNYRDSEKSTSVSFTKSSATVTLSAGTYRFNETLNIPKGTDIEQNITGKMNTLTGNNTYGAQKAFAIMYVAYLDDPTNPITTMQILDETADNFVIYTGGWQYNDEETGETYPVTDTTKLRTITIETDQQVSQEFKTWFDNNTTSVSSFTQVAVTLTNPFSSYISINASNAPFGRISNMDKTKIYSIQLTEDYYKNDITYLTYNGTQWVANGALINIKNQTETSVDLYKGITGGATDSLFAVIALEGTTQASVNDFTGFTGTETMPDYICLIEGTLVTLADGSTKPIEDITYDDELLVWNFYDGKFDKAKPCWITKPQVAHEYNLCKFSNGVEIGFVGQGGDIGYHRIYNDELKSFTHTGVKETPIGTHTFAQDGSKPTLVEQHIVNKQVRYYNVGTEKHINIFTNGILTSARISNKYAIKDMKYISERLINEEFEQEYIKEILKRC